MGFSAVRDVLAYSKAKPAARLILLILAHHVQDDSGLAWPALTTIAREAGLTVRPVWESINYLIEIGELVIDRPGGGRTRVNITTGKQGGRSNCYRLNVAAANHVAGNNVGDSNIAVSSSNIAADSQGSSLRDHHSEIITKSKREIAPNGASHALVLEAEEVTARPDGGIKRAKTPAAKKRKQRPPDFWERWLDNELAPAHPNACQHDAALAWLRKYRPDETRRKSILDMQAQWKQSPDWLKENGNNVPGLRKFLADSKYSRSPNNGAGSNNQRGSMTAEDLWNGPSAATKH